MPGWSAVLAIVAGMLGLLLVLLLVVPIDARARVPGVLMPADGLVEIPSPLAGTVSRVFVEAGASVVAGTPLFEIDSNHLQAARSTARSTSREALQLEQQSVLQAWRAEQQRLGARHEEFEAALRQAREDLDWTERELALRAEQRDLAARERERANKALADGLISAQRFSEQERMLLDIRAGLHRLERERVAASRSIAQIRAQLADLPRERARVEAAHVRRRTELEIEVAALQPQEREIVTAPIDGAVTTVVVAAGQTAEPGTLLASMARPDQPLVVVMAAPLTLPGRITEGAEVVGRVASFPYQRHGHLRAQVSSISSTPLSGGQLHAYGLESEAGSYRVVAVVVDAGGLDLQGQALRIGMAVDADIILDRRRLWDWFVEPLRRARLSASAS